MYSLRYETNNVTAFIQAVGAVGGITVGWALTRSPLGGLIGGVLGLAAGTIIGAAIESIIESTRESSSATIYHRRSQGSLILQPTY